MLDVEASNRLGGRSNWVTEAWTALAELVDAFLVLGEVAAELVASSPVMSVALTGLLAEGKAHKQRTMGGRMILGAAALDCFSSSLSVASFTQYQLPAPLVHCRGVQMKKEILGAASLLAASMFFACQTQETSGVGSVADEENTTASALTSEPTAAVDPNAALATESALMGSWNVPAGIQESSAQSSLEFTVRNTTGESLTADIRLSLVGLGVERDLELGSRTVAPHQESVVAWQPAASPIRPVGTSARIVARLSYQQGTQRQNIPVTPLSLAFSADQTRAFVSWSDDTGVRLRSLGRDVTSKASASEDRAALLEALGSRIGILDGAKRSESAAEASANRVAVAASADGPPKPGAGDGDTVALPLELSSAGGDAVTAGGPVITICNIPLHLNTTRGKMCSNWNPQGHRDLGVSSSVVYEDHTFNPSAYANATAYNNGGALWSGRLDESGCTPALEWCTNKESLSVSTTSLKQPNYTVGATFYYGTRDFQVLPVTGDYAASVATRYCFTSTDCRSIFNVTSSAPQVRVANILSRILTMPDNGVLRAGLGYVPPSVAVHTETGCAGYIGDNPGYPQDFSYVDPVTGQTKYGEACADSDGNAVYLGEALKLVQDGSGQYVYVDAGWHTTIDAFTIAHELGHVAQGSFAGGPYNTGYADKPPTGNCSCSYITESNRAHCLQSRHFQASAEVEGFAHLYATRIMNDQGGDARFTYYKPYLVRNVPNQVVNPPIPLSVNAPYSGVGWVKVACPNPGSSQASEYDWLNFLWGVDGNALTSARSTLSDLFAILGPFRGNESNFIWTNIANSADARFAANTPKALRFRTQGTANGLDL